MWPSIISHACVAGLGLVKGPSSRSEVGLWLARPQDGARDVTSGLSKSQGAIKWERQLQKALPEGVAHASRNLPGMQAYGQANSSHYEKE